MVTSSTGRIATGIPAKNSLQNGLIAVPRSGCPAAKDPPPPPWGHGGCRILQQLSKRLVF
jgi:hypothetical protein